MFARSALLSTRPSSPTARAGCRSRRRHELYFEECGNPNGKPVVFVHGGPGGGTDADHAALLRPGRATASCCSISAAAASRTPHASLEDNTTWDLVADIERLREHLGHRALAGVRRLVGQHARARLRGDAPGARHASWCCAASSCCASAELDWFYQDGASWLFPDAWEDYPQPIPPEERGDLIAAYHRRLTEPRPRRCSSRRRRRGAIWEGTHAACMPNPELIEQLGADDFALAFARIECHYFVNGGFFERDDQLLARRATASATSPASSCRAATTWCAGEERLGPAPRLARGRSAHRRRRRPRRVRARHRPRAGQRDAAAVELGVSWVKPEGP